METVLPAYHVQLIAVNDGFDMDTSSADELSIILKNLLNDFYSRDLSRRFSDSYDLRVASGVFRHGLPYGYTYDKDRPAYMTYDKKVYHIVKLIFQWGLEGMSVSGIASRLNKMGLSPSDSGTMNGPLIRSASFCLTPFMPAILSPRKAMTASVTLSVSVQ